MQKQRLKNSFFVNITSRLGLEGFEDLYPQNIRCQNNNTLSKKTRKIPVKTG